MQEKHIARCINEYVPDYVVFDLETTGISCLRDCVVEISAVKVIDRVITDEFTTLVNPQMHISAGASQVNGITDDMVKDAPLFEHVLNSFLDFAGDMVLVGHNIGSFDMKFIYRDCQRYYGFIPANDYIDTLPLARRVLPELQHHRLVDLAQYYRISSDGAHRALNDCRMNQKVFEYLATEAANKKTVNYCEKICPRCGSPMQKRNGKFGEFWGCTGFPQCRYTENIHQPFKNVRLD